MIAVACDRRWNAFIFFCRSFCMWFSRQLIWELEMCHDTTYWNTFLARRRFPWIKNYHLPHCSRLHLLAQQFVHTTNRANHFSCSTLLLPHTQRIAVFGFSFSAKKTNFFSLSLSRRTFSCLRWVNDNATVFFLLLFSLAAFCTVDERHNQHSCAWDSALALQHKRKNDALASIGAIHIFTLRRIQMDMWRHRSQCTFCRHCHLCFYTYVLRTKLCCSSFHMAQKGKTKRSNRRERNEGATEREMWKITFSVYLCACERSASCARQLHGRLYYCVFIGHWVQLDRIHSLDLCVCAGQREAQRLWRSFWFFLLHHFTLWCRSLRHCFCCYLRLYFVRVGHRFTRACRPCFVHANVCILQLLEQNTGPFRRKNEMKKKTQTHTHTKEEVFRK